MANGSGEVLRFHADDAGLRAWVSDANRRPIVAVLVSKDLAPQPPDTACLLDLAAMASPGGRLTRTWQADWNGHRTTRTRDQVDKPEPDPAIRAAEAAVLNGADCGATARLELFEAAVGALVDLLSGRQCAPEVPPPRAGLNIRAVLPAGAQVSASSSLAGSPCPLFHPPTASGGPPDFPERT